MITTLNIYFMIDDPDYCKYIDCTELEAIKLCPVTCNDPAEPSWCQGADCSYPEVEEKCKVTCSQDSQEGIYHQNF